MESRRKPKAVVSWSSGKDSAYAMQRVVEEDEFEIVGILTTVTSSYGRVSMHGVREELLARQAAELGLPSWKVSIPSPCPNEVYEREMRGALQELETIGVSRVVFGDLFLEDIRDYREKRLGEVGMRGLYPLWRQSTAELAREMIRVGLTARLTCVDPRQIDPSFAGRDFDADLLGALPKSADPCGENGEFHTVVTSSPLFGRPIETTVGEIVTRDGFVFADVALAAP